MEEGSNQQNPSISNSATYSDPSTDRKHVAMLERLSNLHKSRLQQSISGKADSNSAPEFESTHLFLKRFSETKRTIENELYHCRSILNPDDKSQLKSDLENVAIAINDLEKLVAENSYFLPSYDVRSSLSAIAELKETLENANSELVPKKKFAFRKKTINKDRIKDQEEIKSQKNDSISVEKSCFSIPEAPGFRNQKDTVLVKDLTDFKDGDFMLSDLIGCEIYLKGSLRALFVHRLRNCRVFMGPVMGSILIEEVEGCLFMLASHQIRIHQARTTDFYLRVRSRPIIENCNGVRFAPYALFYEGIVKDLRDSSLADETGNWANVDDFLWLSAVQSLNWCILPEEERLCTVNISNAEIRSEHSGS